MYLCLFIVLTLSFSHLVINTASFELQSCFFKICGGILEIFKKIGDDIKCRLTASKCKLDAKRQEFQMLIKQFFNRSVSKALHNTPFKKKKISFGNLKNSTDGVNNITVQINKNTQKTKNRTLNTFRKSFTHDNVNLNGYIAEAHTVITPDGYILTLHRIPAQGRQEGKKLVSNRTVILHHGLLGSSMDWILLGPNMSLPHLLTKAGYDVWLANARGNKYSKAHVTKSVHSSDYWDFSWHEIGLYDLSSTIDYIKGKTRNKSEIIFIAHSMGATALMVLLSTSPQYNMILSLVVLLAPMIYMQQAKGPLRLISEFQYLDHNATVQCLGGNNFNPIQSFVNVLVKNFCRGDIKLCNHPLILISDGGKSILPYKHLVNILTNVQAEGSVKTLLHYGQLINSGKFEMYDRGSAMNIKKYGVVSPPKYHLRDVKLPVALFSSYNDWLSTVPDILKFLSFLPNPVIHHVVQMLNHREFNHFDFVWGSDAPQLVYKFIFDILDQY